MSTPNDVDYAFALLMAAILHRDLVSAMPPSFLTSMPEDIRNRLMAPYYQDSFDALPAEVQRQARALVDADPDMIAAREIGARL